MPKKAKTDFFQMIINQAELTLKGLEIFVEYCKDNNTETGEKVITYEKKADEARLFLINNLNKSFSTPFDREDIFELSSAIDDVIDYAKNSVIEHKIYKVEPDDYIRKMSLLLLDMAKGIYEAAVNLEKNKEICTQHCVKVKKLENKVNAVYIEALSNLFEGNDFKKILIYRELYRHLNNASDKGDNAANIFLNIIVKM